MAKLAYTLGKKISLVIVKSEGFNVVYERSNNWLKTTTKDGLHKLVKVQLQSRFRKVHSDGQIGIHFGKKDLLSHRQIGGF